MRRPPLLATLLLLGGCAYVPNVSNLIPDISVLSIGVPRFVKVAARWPFAWLLDDNDQTIHVAVTGQDGDTSMIPLRVCRPDGDGKFPVAIINHGGPPPGRPRAGMELPNCDSPPAQFFLARGYVVVFPLRRGYGDRDTAWAQNPGSCASPDFVNSAIEGGRDIDAAVTASDNLPYAKSDGMVILGEDEGAWAMLGYALRPNPNIAAFIVMGGGEGGRAANMPRRTCRPDLLIAAARQLGAIERTRMLWIYAMNDPVFSPDLAAALHDAFVGAGGHAELAQPDHAAKDPHALLFSDTGVLVWGPLVARFLDS
jgi:pimeloyl-ACP methyl ester carboxylesterase